MSHILFITCAKKAIINLTVDTYVHFCIDWRDALVAHSIFSAYDVISQLNILVFNVLRTYR